MASQPTARFEPEPPVHYDPYELCVVFAPTKERASERDHDTIATAINQWLLTEAPRFFARLKDTPLARTLRPSRAFLVRLDQRRVFLTMPRTAAPAFVDIPPGRRGDGPAGGRSALGFYQIGGQRRAFPAGAAVEWPAVAADLRIVRDLVNLLTLAIAGGEFAERAPGLVAATPNWLCSAAHISPSPGSKPEAVGEDDLPDKSIWEKRGWTFRFDSKKLDAARARARGDDVAAEPVVVAILDTRPEPDEVEASKDKNPLFQRLVATFGPEIGGEPLSFPQSRFDRLGALSPNRIAGTQAKYRLRDHGLFIAGIIHDIAPRAELHLIRVLGGYGVSALQEVAEALWRVHRAFVLERQVARLIVNLSLGLSIPPGGDLLEEWVFEAIRQRRADDGDLPELRDLEARFGKVLAEIQTRLTPADGFDRKLADLIRSGTTEVAGIDLVELQGYLAAVRRSATEIFAWIEARPEVLVIAAAGNDHHGGDPPEPRYPASDERAMGVAAINRRSPAGPARYTNRGDTGILDDGVAVWGGDVRAPLPDYALAQIDLAAGEVDAVRGIYSTDEAIGPNTTGWAYWSGTSFAAPIISGIAAALWAVTDPANASDIKQAIRAEATTNAPGLAVRMLGVRQVPL